MSIKGQNDSGRNDRPRETASSGLIKPCSDVHGGGNHDRQRSLMFLTNDAATALF